MPDGLETYMSPVLHRLDDGSAYILFGHGGETVPGSTSYLIQQHVDWVLSSDFKPPALHLTTSKAYASVAV